MNELPEVALARRLIERKRIAPPIDVRALAEEYAILTEIDIPVEVDGVCLNLKSLTCRPEIILNSSRSHRRKRFTLAHELGHVLIPWHTGSIVDETDATGSDNSEYWRLEAEANRFASELLMPRSWMRDTIAKSSDPATASRSVSHGADVSIKAAVIKTIASLDAGFMYVEFSGDEVLSSGRSQGTLANEPAWGSRIDPESLFAWTPHRWTHSYNGVRYLWLHFPAHTSAPTTAQDVEWRAVLDVIMQDLVLSDTDAMKFKQSLNGVVANAHGSVRTNKTAGAVYSACLQRLESRARDNRVLRRFLDHPRRDDYLAARIREFLS